MAKTFRFIKWLLKPSIGIGLALALAVIILHFTPLGAASDRIDFFIPVQQLRSAKDILQKISPRLRVVVFDDYFYARWKRPSSTSDAIKVADRLAQLGYKKIFISGIPDSFEALPYAPNLVKNDETFQLVIAASEVATLSNPRSTPATSIDQAHLLLSEDSINPQKRTLESTIIPGSNILQSVKNTKIGHQYFYNNYTIPGLLSLGDGRYIPHFSLWAFDDLSVTKDGHVYDKFHVIPTSFDGRYYIDPPSKKALASISLSAADFFSSPKITDNNSANETLEEKLSGGDVALIETHGYTGSTQFLDTSIGRVPRFHADAAMINSVLLNNILVMPLNPIFFLVGWSVVITALLVFLPGFYALVITGTLGLFFYIFAALILINKGLYLPAGQCAILCLVGIFAKFNYDGFAFIRYKVGVSKDLEFGQAVQTLFLPEIRDSSVGNWDYKIFFNPSGPMAGDWFQIFEFHPESTATPLALLCIGDVTGKGPSAALGTASIATIFQVFFSEWRESNKSFDFDFFISQLDKALFATFRGDQPTSLSVAIIWEEQIKLLSFGAPKWLKISKCDNKLETVRNGQCNLIGFSGETIKSESVDLQCIGGDYLIAYTDGVLEGSKAIAKFKKYCAKINLQQEFLAASTLLAEKALKAGRSYVHDDDATIIVIHKKY